MRKIKRDQSSGQEQETPLLMKLLGQEDAPTQELEQASAAGQPAASKGPDHEQVGKRVARVLNAAEETAEEITAEAERDAAQIRQRAEDDAAARMREADERRAEVDAEAREKLAEADDEARASHETAQKMAQEIEDAATRRQAELQEEIKSLEGQHRHALDELREISRELQRLLDRTAPTEGDEPFADAFDNARN